MAQQNNQKKYRYEREDIENERVSISVPKRERKNARMNTGISFERRNRSHRSAGLSTGGLSPNEQMAVNQGIQGGIMRRMAQNHQEREERRNNQNEVCFLLIFLRIFVILSRFINFI